jgi:tetratricopeptide (TPR) repeat protein
MEKALARHDAILVQTVSEHGGTLLKHKSEGDSAFAVFGRASAAVAAALAAQRAFGVEPWPDGCVIRVRMAVHTGEAELRDGDYYGPAVNRTARLRGIAHGGQTVISQATADLIRERVPEGARLVDMGVHRLPDLGGAEVVFGLAHADVASQFPPLRSLDALPNNLPVQLTSFVGRDEELAELRDLLGGHRLVTLTGAAGCGKTRLALQVAAEMLDTYRAGVWLVDFAPLADPDLATRVVARTLGVREPAVSTLLDALDAGGQNARPLLDLMIEHLRSRELLLVLDNCEHLLEAAAALVGALLRGCGDLRVLATSREALGVAGEVSWRVRSLSLPDPKRLPGVEELGDYEAIRLFVDRARAHVPRFMLTAEDGPAVAQVCRRLDGIPLAIELAAARVETLSAGELGGIAYALHQRAVVAVHRADYSTAEALASEALPLMRRAGDNQGVAQMIAMRGIAITAQREFQAAAPIFQEALDLWRQLGNEGAVRMMHVFLGSIALVTDEPATARQHFEDAYAIARDLGDRYGEVLAAAGLGEHALTAGDVARAVEWYTEATQHCAATDAGALAPVLAGLGKVAAAESSWVRAARLFGAAERTLEDDPIRRMPLRWLLYEHLYDQHLDRARSALGNDAFARAFAEGRAMSHEAAVAHALERDPPR